MSWKPCGANEEQAPSWNLKGITRGQSPLMHMQRSLAGEVKGPLKVEYPDSEAIVSIRR